MTERKDDTMTQALAYGIQIELNEFTRVCDMDITDYSIMKRYLGDKTGVFYLNHKSPNRIAGVVKQLVVLVTCYNRGLHDFVHYLIATESFVLTDKLGKMLPGGHSAWDELIHGQFIHFRQRVEDEKVKYSACKTIHEIRPWSQEHDGYVFNPTWLILDSDD